MPVSVIFQSSTEIAQDPIGLRLDAMPLFGDENVEDEAYATDARDLVRQLPKFMRSAAADWDFANTPPTVFLTGATGFLGSYILHELLDYQGTYYRTCASRGCSGGSQSAREHNKGLRPVVSSLDNYIEARGRVRGYL